ncbi:MAG: galactose-1-phosphate uridylyltransferase [Candidatus Omnitrophica bacterium]|nr:galactose-1-phosphate uridylyltransferase [Candidatus Omnitrophota bacterium]MCM8798683.1 galactose-1-phosphate uridylyltransferase [Candidatus Omnitrophota bacterium]
MAELRRDPITGRWVIVGNDKEIRPEDFEVESHEKGKGICPFCPGNEAMTPPEIIAHREGQTAPNTPGWLTRVVPNKFPALQIEGSLNKRGIGVYDLSNGIGAHEVIIENPDHNREIADLYDHEVERIVWCYRNRSIDLRGDKRFKYILIFKNYGKSAGASLEHPHSQLIALPVIPKRVQEELRGSQRYFEYRERCVFCDMVKQELQDGKRIVAENKHFVAFTPFVSCFPFEFWIIPKEHESDFSYLQREEAVSFASILREMLKRVKVILRDPSFNFIIHTSPLEEMEKEDYHWHLEFMPKLTRLAGFEWGTGFYINPMRPSLAARYLREAKI